MEHSIEALDPEAEAVVRELLDEGLPPWHALSVESARRLEDEVFSAGGGPAMASVRDIAIDAGDRAIPLRWYRPTETPRGTIVFLHGGGWTLGTLDSADDICRHLANQVDAVVLSVDYRLAPEHPFPAALEDAWEALTWAGRYASRLGGDDDRLAIAGTSAGAYLAAATAIRARHGSPDLRGQFLFYPITDHDFQSDSYEEHAAGPLLSREDMRWFWSNYLRSPIDAHHPFASVLRAPDVSGVAPALVVTAGVDVLRDEGIAYAAKLDDDGVEVDHLHHPELPHGFVSLTDRVERAAEAMDRLGAAMRDRLA